LHQTNPQSNQDATNASKSPFLPPGARASSDRRSSVFGGEILSKTPVTYTRISDESLGQNLKNVLWDWNESMWQSAVKAVEHVRNTALKQQETECVKNIFAKCFSSDVSNKTAAEQCDTIIYERTVDYQLNFMGENLFHL
jgi:hypothetical protein